MRCCVVYKDKNGSRLAHGRFSDVPDSLFMCAVFLWLRSCADGHAQASGKLQVLMGYVSFVNYHIVLSQSL